MEASFHPNLGRRGGAGVDLGQTCGALQAATTSFAVADGSAWAQPKGKDKERKDASSGFQAVAFVPVQQVVGETWIGYAYIDEWGDEVIYWFPYDIVYDPWTDTTEYVPAY